MLKAGAVKGELPSSREAYANLVKIAIPSVIEMVFMSLIGAADTVMVGVLGFEAIAAVGLVGQPRMLMLALFFALNVGVTAIVARRKGQNLQEDANRTLRNAILLALALAAIIMAAGLSFARPLMLLAGAKSDTIVMSTDYFNILAWFLPINGLTMCINAAQRGIGNTRITMYANVAANLVNVVFNYLLIGGNLGFPRLEVKGAAIATAIGFCVSFALSLAALLNGNRTGAFLRVRRGDSWKPHKETLAAIVKVGGNAMIEQGAMRIGFFAYAAIVASLGTAAFAAHQVGMQFLNVSFTFGDGLAVAGTALVGQMLGSERPDMATIYGKCSQRLAFCVSLALAACMILFRRQFVGIFLDEANPGNLASIGLAVDLMFMVAFFQPVQMSSVVISGCLRGAGDNLYVALVMIVCVVFVRPLLSLCTIGLLGFGLVGAWGSSLVDMIVRLTLMYRRFNGGKWQLKKV
jgi:putative MATE family efflux protein